MFVMANENTHERDKNTVNANLSGYFESMANGITSFSNFHRFGKC